MIACKNWNESRRGDAAFNVSRMKANMVGVGAMENSANFINPVTGETNYDEYRKSHMKEDWRRVETFETGKVVQREDLAFESSFDRRYLSLSCHHCETPACVEACPEQIIYKEQTFGAVLVNNEKCISCGKCLKACPWDAPGFYDDSSLYDEDDPRRPKMTKCTLCKERISEGLKPACVAACWNRALDAGPMDELKTKYGKDCVTALPEFNSDYVPSLKIHTRPNLLLKPKQDALRSAFDDEIENISRYGRI